MTAVLAPLHSQASGKGQHIDWSKECQNAFNKVKEVLSEAVLLHHPQPNAPTSLTVDASITAIGAQLEQRQSGSWVSLAFFSKKLSDYEKKYSAFDRELLASYGAIRHFRHILEGLPFTLCTDHKPLTSTLISQTERSPRQTRHVSSFIAKFTTDIQHIKGKFNVVADTLFRISAVGSSYTEDVEMASYRTADTGLILKDINIGKTTLLCDTSMGDPRSLLPTS